MTLILLIVYIFFGWMLPEELRQGALIFIGVLIIADGLQGIRFSILFPLFFVPIGIFTIIVGMMSEPGTEKSMNEFVEKENLDNIADKMEATRHFLGIGDSPMEAVIGGLVIGGVIFAILFIIGMCSGSR